MEPNRDQHLAWCKARALEYCDKGFPHQAVASMLSDLGKHQGTDYFVDSQRVVGTMTAIHLGNEAVRRWIEGFV